MCTCIAATIRINRLFKCRLHTILFFVFTCTRLYSQDSQDYITVLPDEPKKAIIYLVIESVYTEEWDADTALKSLITFAQLSKSWNTFIVELPHLETFEIVQRRCKVVQRESEKVVQKKSKYDQLEQLFADTENPWIWAYNILIGRCDNEKCRSFLISLARKNLRADS